MRIIRPPKKHRLRTLVTVCLLASTAAAAIGYYLNGGPYWLLWIPLLLACDVADILWGKLRGRRRGQVRERRWPGLLAGMAALLAASLLISLTFSLGYGANHLAAALGILAGAICVLELIRTRRSRALRGDAIRPCPHCGYERRSLGPRALCPECGRSPWL